MGNGKMAERGGGRRDFFGDGGDGRPRGSPLPVLVGVRRDGCPHARGQREGEDGLRGQREGDFRLHGGAVSGGMGMGPRMTREGDAYRLHGGGCERGGRGWVPASARTTGGDGSRLPSSRGQAVSGGRGWVPASARGQREGEDSRLRLHGGRL